MTHVTYRFFEKNLEKVAKRFVNRNENVVTLQPR